MIATLSKVGDSFRQVSRNQCEGDHMPSGAVIHRDQEYDSRSHALLQRMQEGHFWYRGRHRFLLEAVHRHLGSYADQEAALDLVDLGGGCGGWLSFMLARRFFAVDDVVLADSSAEALSMAADSVPPFVKRRQVDLMDLPWSGRFDIAFLLDVLEHLPDERAILSQIRAALVPGGLLFITVPALRNFWSWNDDVCRHLRRYARRDFIRLAAESGFELLDSRYFMFILSPILVASRFAVATTIRMPTEARKRELAEKMHAVPGPLINTILTSAFAAETPLGHIIRFPWGTSLLAALRRPAE
jgi:2-polyprenyl-3-methyl-5-hydroxy-6-metoxy-1,4-benzoquinol methylase